MSKRLKQAIVVVVVLVAIGALIQLVQPDRTNPPVDATRSLQAHRELSAVAAVVDRSCRDCHSNETVWPSYARAAPMSWLMASAVSKGRDAVNFSEWESYPPEQQRRLLTLSCQDATAGKMPGIYARLQPETKLSPQDIDTICAAARQTDASRR